MPANNLEETSANKKQPPPPNEGGSHNNNNHQTNKKQQQIRTPFLFSSRADVDVGLLARFVPEFFLNYFFMVVVAVSECLLLLVRPSRGRRACGPPPYHPVPSIHRSVPPRPSFLGVCSICGSLLSSPSKPPPPTTTCRGKQQQQQPTGRPLLLFSGSHPTNKHTHTHTPTTSRTLCFVVFFLFFFGGCSLFIYFHGSSSFVQSTISGFCYFFGFLFPPSCSSSSSSGGCLLVLVGGWSILVALRFLLR
jgi:hypothetical protein